MRNIGIPDTPVDVEINTLAAQYGNRPDAVLPILRTLHTRHHSLTGPMLTDVARALGLSAARVYGVASFYAMLSTHLQAPHTIRVCDGPPCWLRGATQVRAAADRTFGPAWTVDRTSCLGLCDRAPAALVDEQPCGPLTPATVPAIREGWRGAMPTYAQMLPGEVRLLMAQAGQLDPPSLQAALDHGIYQGLHKGLQTQPPQVIEAVEAAGLRGRGGAGFPTGRKWRLVAEQPHLPKYVVCNADESEPLLFKDRVLLETNPHQVLEGMAIAAYAVGANAGVIYIRGEYATQAALLEQAIHQAEAQGYLGDRILETDFSFHIHVHRGAGAYICGEETALMESLQGKRGEPRVRPPYPTTHGYQGRPTVVNNVETLAAVPAILTKGARWYRALGHPELAGTKLYTVLGHVNRPGLFEAPFGLTLRRIIDQFGDGMRAGSAFHFALVGGAAGTIVPPALLDVPLDVPSTDEVISSGSGGVLICDQSVSPVELLRELLRFFEAESCGKCTPCRIGTRQARQRLDRLVTYEGHSDDVEALAELAELLDKDSFCGLGRSAAWPISAALRHFGEAFTRRQRQ